MFANNLFKALSSLQLIAFLHRESCGASILVTNRACLAVLVALAVVAGLVLASNIYYNNLQLYLVIPDKHSVTRTTIVVVPVTYTKLATLTITRIQTVTPPPSTVRVTVPVTVNKVLTVTKTAYKIYTVTATTTIPSVTVKVVTQSLQETPLASCRTSWRHHIQACSLQTAYVLHANTTNSLVDMLGPISSDPYKALEDIAARVGSAIRYEKRSQLMLRVAEEILDSGKGDYEDYAILAMSYMLDAGFSGVRVYVLTNTFLKKPLVFAGLNIAGIDYVVAWWSPKTLIDVKELAILFAQILKSPVNVTVFSIEKMGSRVVVVRDYMFTCTIDGVVGYRVELDKVDRATRIALMLQGYKLSKSPLLSKAAAEIALYGHLTNTTEKLFSLLLPSYSIYRFSVPLPWTNSKPISAVVQFLYEAIEMGETENNLVGVNTTIVYDYYMLPGVGSVRVPVAYIGIVASKPYTLPQRDIIVASVEEVKARLTAQGYSVLLSPPISISKLVELLPKAIAGNGVAVGEVQGYKACVVVMKPPYPQSVEQLATAIMNSIRNCIKDFNTVYLALEPIEISHLNILVVFIVGR